VRQVLDQVNSTTPLNGEPSENTAFPQYDTVKDAVSALEARQYLELHGQMLHSRYRVESTLDISSKAGVFKAFDTWIERPVTVKVLSRSLGSEANHMLLREARALARLDHANIVSVYDCVEYQDHLYLVREYIEGETLESWIECLGTEKYALPSKAIVIARDILGGLAYAHEHEVIHRYIHPKNIILSGDYAKIMNFGLTDCPEEVWSPDKVVYMSPEQLAQRTLSARTDLYSFGVLLYRLLTGRLPFEADTLAELIEQCTYATPVAPRQINAKIPLAIECTILNLLAKDPGSRQATAKVVLEELERIELWTWLTPESDTMRGRGTRLRHKTTAPGR
jgi:serine/threonine protein kinase